MNTKEKFRPTLKQTAFGPSPIDWDVCRIGDISEIITSGSRGWAKYYSEVGSLFVRSQNVRDGKLDFSDRQYVTPPRNSEGSRTQLKRDDLLITITGNSVGNVAWVQEDLGEAYVSQHVGLVRLQDPSLSEYANLFLAPGSPGNIQIWAAQAGQSKPGLNLKNLADFCILLPPSSERLLIAAAVKEGDDQIASLDALIAKKRDLKQAAMQQLLTGKTRLPGFSGEWEVTRLGEHVKFLKNGTLSRADLVTDGFINYLHYGDIHSARRLSLDPVQTEMPKAPASQVQNLDRLSDGDLVFVDASEDLDGVGKSIELVGIKGREVVSGLHTIAARFDKGVLADGFKAYLQFIPSFSRHLRSLAAGTKVLATNRKHISSAEIKLPPPSEQSAIAEILSDMDQEIAALEAETEKARAIKQGMMQTLLTGKVRLV